MTLEIPSRSQVSPRLAGALPVVVGGLVLAGWAFGIASLTYAGKNAPEARTLMAMFRVIILGHRK